MKLFSGEQSIFNRTEPYLTRNGVVLEEHEFMNDVTYESLEIAIEAFGELIDLKSTLLDNKDHINPSSVYFYNSKIKEVFKSLNIDCEHYCISMEEVQDSHYLFISQRIAMESIIKKVWRGISLAFKKIYEAAAFALSRFNDRSVKATKDIRKMIELLEGLGDKDAKVPNSSSIPKSLARDFKGRRTIDEGALKVANSGATALPVIMKAINDATKPLVKLSKARDHLKSEVDRAITSGKYSPKDGESGEPSKTMTEVNNTSGYDDDAAGTSTGERGELSVFSDKVTKIINNGLKGKSIITPKGLKKLKEARRDPKDNKVVFEFDDGEDEVTGLVILNKESLLSILMTNVDMAEGLVGIRRDYTKINDELMKSVKDMDSLMSKAASGVKEGGSEIQRLIKTEMSDIRKFFQGYNDIQKNFFGCVVDTLEADYNYAKECLKYYG